MIFSSCFCELSCQFLSPPVFIYHISLSFAYTLCCWWAVVSLLCVNQYKTSSLSADFFFLYCFGFTHWWLVAKLVAFFYLLPTAAESKLSFGLQSYDFVFLPFKCTFEFWLSHQEKQKKRFKCRLQAGWEHGWKWYWRKTNCFALQSILVRKEKHKRAHAYWHTVKDAHTGSLSGYTRTFHKLYEKWTRTMAAGGSWRWLGGV